MGRRSLVRGGLEGILLLFTGMSSVGGVLVVAIPAVLGSSVLSTLLTTYVTQSGERRRARAEVRAAMRASEMAAIAQATSGKEMRDLTDEFIRVAMLARVPMPLVDLYVVAITKVWAMQHPLGGEVMDPVARRAVARVSGEAFSLLVTATWRPYWGRLAVWRRTRRYRRILVGAVPELDREYMEPRSGMRRWEREMLQAERRHRRARRPASLVPPAPYEGDAAAISESPPAGRVSRVVANGRTDETTPMKRSPRERRTTSFSLR